MERATENGIESQSVVSFSFEILMVGGIVRCCMAKITLIRLARPAVSKVWPIFDLTLPIGIFCPSR